MPDLPILFPAYLSGMILAAAFYLTMPSLSWQNIVVGDPLCAPFRRLLWGDRMGGFDFSPVVVLIVLQIMRGMLVGAL